MAAAWPGDVRNSVPSPILGSEKWEMGQGGGFADELDVDELVGGGWWWRSEDGEGGESVVSVLGWK